MSNLTRSKYVNLMNENWSDNRTADDGLQKHAGQRVKLRGSGSGHGSARGPSGFKTTAFQWVINNPFNLFFLTFIFIFFLFWLLERKTLVSLYLRFPASLYRRGPPSAGEIFDRWWPLSRDQDLIFPDLGSISLEFEPIAANRGLNLGKNLFFFLFFVPALRFPAPGDSL